MFQLTYVVVFRQYTRRSFRIKNKSIYIFLRNMDLSVNSLKMSESVWQNMLE
jgi:hypothetical protein